MSLTPNYSLVYLDSVTDKYVSAANEARNWGFLDWQWHGMTELIGGGVIGGWLASDSGGLSVDISMGSGLVNGYIGETTEIYYNLPVVANETNYIYVQANDNTAIDGSVTFVVDQILGMVADAELLSAVVTDTDSIVSIDNSVRTNAGWSGFLQTYLETHTHDGNPIPFIDLALHVTGVLSEDNIGNIPSTKITGILNVSSIPQQSHTVLTDIGAYTHPEIDVFLNTLTDDRYKEFGDVMGIGLAQTLLSLGHIYYEREDVGGFFRFIPNVIMIIPGISVVLAEDDTPNYPSLIDRALTDATIDEANRRFESGLATPLSPSENYSREFTSDTDWNGAVTQSNVVVAGGSVTLSVESSSSTYELSGVLVLRYDTGRISSFGAITWDLEAGSIDDPIGVRTRTAATEDGLDDASYSTEITLSGSAITSGTNRWIELEITLRTDDDSVSPVLDAITVNYEAAGGACGRMLWPVFESFALGTLTNVKLDWRVSGAGIADANGVYTQIGTYIDNVLYWNQDSALYNWHLLWEPYFNAWLIASFDYTGDRAPLYIGPPGVVSLPANPWTVSGVGIAPGPTLTAVEQVTLEVTGTGTYLTTGTATSMGNYATDWDSWVSLSWDEVVESGVTDIAVYYRMAATIEGLGAKAWVGPYTDPAGVDLSGAIDPGEYIQLLAVFTTTNTGRTPVLKDLTLVWRRM